MKLPIERETQAQKRFIPLGWKVIVVFVALSGLSAFYFNQVSAKKLPDTVVEVQDRIQGVWTFTQPTDGKKPPYGWERWTFTLNGLAIQSAHPSHTAWSAPSNFAYEISRRKTGDTGEWYWHVHAKDSGVDAALFKSGNLVASMGGGLYPLTKIDHDLGK